MVAKIGELKFEYLVYCKQPKSFRVNGFVKLAIVVDPTSKSGYLVAQEGVISMVVFFVRPNDSETYDFS